MTIILASILHTHYYTKRGKKRAMALRDTNGILTNMRKHIKRCGRVVYVANDPHDVKHNKKGFKPVIKGLKMSGFRFKEKYVLDDSTRSMASEIVSGADLIILSGGKILCQREFFNDIGLKELLSKSDALVIGTSAGAMNLCDEICNFPEETADLDQPRWVSGMGFFGELIIPHFDGDNLVYQLPCNEIDVVNDYILPLSGGRTMLGLDNDAYILIENGAPSYFGNFWTISDGVVERKQA